MEVHVRVTDAKLCQEVLDDVLNSLGPSDGTVFVSLQDADLPYGSEMEDAITKKMGQLGEILLTRLVT